MIKHVFFDLDRTLWDFEANSHNTLEALFSEYSLKARLSVEALDFITEYKLVNERCWSLYRKGKLDKETLRHIRFQKTLRKFRTTDDVLALELGERYVNECPKQSRLFPNAIEVLESIRNAGLTLHIITNGFEEVQHVKMAHAKISHFFEVVMTSEQAYCKKPATKIFISALREAGAQAHESVMIGDHYEVDILGAENVGMKGVLFDPEGQHATMRRTDRIEDLKELLPKLGIENRTP